MFDANGTHVLAWDPAAVHLWPVSGTARPVTIADDSFIKLQDATISPDGRLIATASTGGSGAEILWDAATGRKLHTLAVDDPRLLGANLGTSVAFSPDSRLLATGSEDGTATVWNTATGTAARTFLVAAHPSAATGTAYVLEATFSPDGTRLLTTTGLPPEQNLGTSVADETQVWNLAGGAQLAHMNGGEATWSPGAGNV
jgi:WD40 repeat protein